MASKGRLLAKLLVDNTGDVAAGSLDNATIADGSITTAKLESSVQTTLSSAVLKDSSTGAASLPVGTTAQRPGSPTTGMTRMNSSTGSIEFYDGANWISTNLIPIINSISGTIYAGASSTITLSLTNATDIIDIKYYEGGTLLATDTSVTVTSDSATSAVPSAVYGRTAGNTISIQVFNQDGTPSSNSIIKTITALPSGGTITASGSYRIHTFTSSSSFVVPSGMTLSNVEYVVVAGGGSAGADYPGTTSGGGGAGGYRSSVVGESSGGGASAENRLTLTAGSYTATIGAGGAGVPTPSGSNWLPGNDGSNSVFGSITSIGGGGSGSSGSAAAIARGGGSGGGGGNAYSGGNNGGGAGTSGQGYAGGNGASATAPYGSGGGGGAGQAGANGHTGAGFGGKGGDGVQSSITGTAIYRAGGGSGGAYESSGGAADATTAGGLGGGGASGDGRQATYPGVNGTANTGGGGGGSRWLNAGVSSAAGGSGIVIVRYQLS